MAKGESPALLDRLDVLRMEFDAACDLFGPVVAADESAIEQSRREIAETVADRDNLARAVDGLSAERGALIRERDHALGERDHALGERDAIRASTSWRLTKPLRKASRLVKAIWPPRNE